MVEDALIRLVDKISVQVLGRKRVRSKVSCKEIVHEDMCKICLTPYVEPSGI